MPNNINVTPLIPVEIKNILSQVGGFVPSFNEQVINLNKQKLILGVQNIIKDQDKSIKELIRRQAQLGVEKNAAIRKAQKDLKHKQITQEQYDTIVANANAKFEEEKLAIDNNRKQILENKKTGLLGLQKKLDSKLKELKKESLNLKNNTLKTQVASQAELAKNVLTNPANLTAIYPALSLLITNAFLNFITQRKKLEKQVDAVNFYIDTQVVDEASVIVATNLKNNTIRAINDAIAKLQAIEAILKVISTALKIASTALKIISLLLILLPAVPGAVLKVFETLNKIINGLSSIVSPCLRILTNEIQKLKALIEKLKQIIIKLNNKTLNILTDAQLLNLIQTILPVGDVALFQTLTAVPVSGSTGFVDIGGRIVPLNSTSAAGSLPTTSSITGTTTGGTGTGAATGSTAGTTTGTGTTAGTTIGTGIGTGGSTTGTGTGTTGTGVIGNGTGSMGSGNVVSNPPVITTPSTVNTSNSGTTNGTGIGLTTTGGTGNGGVNVGPTGIISTNATSSIVPVVGLNNGLDGGLSTIPLENQNIFPINLDQLTLEGLDEAGLNTLEQNLLELTSEDPLLQQSATGLEQVPSLQDQVGLYKGFKFQIKEEQDPRFVVRGFKRRYAVAVNRQGVEVLKSEYSFTLDPNDLVDQLKLVIDRQKLQG